MKKIILALLVITLSLRSFGQSNTSDVVTVDSTLKKQTLYSNALAFFALEFKSASDVIQMKDSETGTIIGKGIVNDQNVTITIVCKDGKYKYNVDVNIVQCHNVNENIIFKVQNFGMNRAESVGKLVCVNGILTIPTEFISVQVVGLSKKTYYDSGEGKNYEKWKVKIDEEILILKQQLADLSNKHIEKSKIAIENLISDLKKEMVKKSDF